MENKINSYDEMIKFLKGSLTQFSEILEKDKLSMIDQGHTNYKGSKNDIKNEKLSHFKKEISAPFVDEIINKNLKDYWNMYRDQQKSDYDVVEFAIVLSALAGLDGNVPFEDVKKFLETTTSDMYQSQYTTNAIAVFSSKGEEFFDFYNKGNGFKFQSPINGVDINLDELKPKKTLI